MILSATRVIALEVEWNDQIIDSFWRQSQKDFGDILHFGDISRKDFGDIIRFIYVEE